MKGYMLAREASYKWGVPESLAHKLCRAGRMPGPERFGRSLAVPADAEKPCDPRSEKRKHPLIRSFGKGVSEPRFFLKSLQNPVVYEGDKGVFSPYNEDRESVPERPERRCAG